MGCNCARPVVSYLDMTFCAKCEGPLTRSQQFHTVHLGGYGQSCAGCGAMVRPDETSMNIHIQIHKDQRLWMESLMIRLGELHGFLLQDQTDKAAAKCQQMLASFPEEWIANQ